MISRGEELRDFSPSSRLIKLTRAVGNRWRVERNKDKNPCSSTSLTALTDSFTFPRFFLPNFVSISLSLSRFSFSDRSMKSIRFEESLSSPFYFSLGPSQLIRDPRFVRDRWWRCAHCVQGRGGGERIIRKFGLAERRPKMRSTRVGNLWMCKRERETERVQSSLTRCRLLIRFLLSNFVLVYISFQSLN